MHYRVTAVKPLGGYRILLKFGDGTEGELDIAEHLSRPFKGVFRPFENLEDFLKLRLDSESGTVVWPWGADLAPDTLYAAVNFKDAAEYLEDYEGSEFPGYILLDEIEDAVSALEFSLDLLEQVTARPYLWKWEVLAFHNAIQGFMVCALSGGHFLLPFTQKAQRAFNRAYANGESKFPEGLEYFIPLYEKVKSDDMLCYTMSKQFISDPETDQAMEDLNRLRGQLTHYMPQGWAIEKLLVVEILLNCLPLLHFLINESGNILWSEESEVRRAREAVTRIEKRLSALNEELQEGALHELPTP